MLSTCQKSQIPVHRESGFSLIELIIVMLVISILSVLALMSFRADDKYLADTQAYQIIDIIQEARQRSLTQHQTMRVEINQTRRTIRLIAENEPGNADDDKEIRNIKLEDPKNVIVGLPPKNIVKNPSDTSISPLLAFKKSVHPLSATDTVATLRFVRNGKVLNAGSNSIGDNSTITGATIYVWMPDDGQTPINGSVIRAITVQAVSGISQYLKCPLTNGKCENWTK